VSEFKRRWEKSKDYTEEKPTGPPREPRDPDHIANNYYPVYDTSKKHVYERPKHLVPMSLVALHVMRHPLEYEPWQVLYYGKRWERLGKVMPTEAREYIAQHMQEAQDMLAWMKVIGA
jgi:hypothetical protein